MEIEKDFNKISVEMIMEKAGVSRSTFYRYFKDKYDVMNSAYLDVSAAMVRDNPDMRKQRNWCIEDFNLIMQHPRFFQKILSYKGQNSFRDTICSFYGRNIRNHIETQTGGKPLSDMEQYAIGAYADVAAYTMIWFIMNSDKVAPERMTDFALDCIPQSLRHYFEPDPNP